MAKAVKSIRKKTGTDLAEATAWLKAVAPRDHLPIQIPDVPQPDDFSCGSCAFLSVTKHYGVGPKTVDEAKRMLGTTKKTSTLPEMIVAGLQKFGLHVEARDNMAIPDLKAATAKGWPVICPIKEYANKPTSEAYGHWVVVIGLIDDLYVIVQDPSFDNILEGEYADAAPGKMLIEAKRWLTVWHDHFPNGKSYVRYGIVVGPPVDDKEAHGQ